MTVVRGWTPTKGGGKPFDYRLSFNVTIDVAAVFSASAGGVRFTSLPPVTANTSIWGDGAQVPLKMPPQVSNGDGRVPLCPW